MFDIAPPEITPEEEALLPRVLAHYDVPWRSFYLLPKWYRWHLRVRVEAADGLGWQLRERSDHLTRADWHFHHYLQPTQPPLATIPALCLARDGSAFVTVDDRDFELIGWLPGESIPISDPAQLVAAGRAIGELHRYLFEVEVPPGQDRRVATTNDMDYLFGALLRDGSALPELHDFIADARALVEVPVVDPLVALHGDIHVYNLVWQDGQVSGFCDWEDAHWNVPCFDMAYFLAHSTFISWPSRTKTGREASILPAIDYAGTEAALRAYRQALGRPIPAANLLKALAETWVMTMRCTILTTAIDPETIRAGHRILRAFADPATCSAWQAILQE